MSIFATPIHWWELHTPPHPVLMNKTYFFKKIYISTKQMQICDIKVIKRRRQTCYQISKKGKLDMIMMQHTKRQDPKRSGIYQGSLFSTHFHFSYTYQNKTPHPHPTTNISDLQTVSFVFLWPTFYSIQTNSSTIAMTTKTIVILIKAINNHPSGMTATGITYYKIGR